VVRIFDITALLHQDACARATQPWGKNWGKVTHGFEPISAELDPANLALDRAPRSPADLRFHPFKPKVASSNLVGRIPNRLAEPEIGSNRSQKASVCKKGGAILQARERIFRGASFPFKAVAAHLDQQRLPMYWREVQRDRFDDGLLGAMPESRLRKV
jgi:hypothetical protein